MEIEMNEVQNNFYKTFQLFEFIIRRKKKNALLQVGYELMRFVTVVKCSTTWPTLLSDKVES